MLGKLTTRGLVQRNHGATYSAGPAVVQLAERYRERSLMQTAISGRLDRLKEDTGEFTAFMVAHGSHALCVEVSEGTRVLRCGYTKGATHPLVCGVAALALLAHISDEALRAAYDEHGLDDAEIAALEMAQEKVRCDGVALSEGHLPAVLGGGYEVAFASYLGLSAARTDSTRRLGVVNLTRTSTCARHRGRRPAPASCRCCRRRSKRAASLRTRCWASRRPAIRVRSSTPRPSGGVRYRSDLECTEAHASGIRTHLERFLGEVDDVYLTLTLDLDAQPGWIAAGASAPAALGVQVDTVLTIVEAIAQSGKLALFDVAELNLDLDLDLDGRTARVAARIINHLVTRTEAT